MAEEKLVDELLDVTVTWDDPADVTVVARERTALRLDVTGVVQGVGFRPFVHRLALRHGLRARDGIALEGECRRVR